MSKPQTEFKDLDEEARDSIIWKIRDLTGAFIVETGPGKVFNMTGKGSSSMDFVEVSVMELVRIMTILSQK